MATPFQIQVGPENSGLLRYTHSKDEASKLSDLLQEDLEKHHVFFNTAGYHNHIAHQLYTLYGTGSNTGALQKAYDHNANYQIKAMPPREPIVQELERDWSNASEYLGKGKYYASFLKYFQDEIERVGWQQTVKEHVFKGDERSHDMFGRLFAGFLHPMIQLMYGIEFAQPATVASGLAQAAVHENKVGEFLTSADEAAAKLDSKMGSIADFFDEIRKDKKLATSASWNDPNRIYDGVMKRAPDEALALVSRVKVAEDELEERTAEMIITAAWVSAAAAFHEPNIPKFDFFLIHHVTSIPMFLTVNAQDWIPTHMKVKLLEWKIRMDIIQYIARGCPRLQPDLLKTYQPKDKDLVAKPEDLLPRFHEIADDGHTIKLVRALLLARQLSLKYHDREWVKIRDDGTWLRVFYLLLDGNEKVDPKWVRSAGFEEAWREIPKDERHKL